MHIGVDTLFEAESAVKAGYSLDNVFILRNISAYLVGSGGILAVDCLGVFDGCADEFAAADIEHIAALNRNKRVCLAVEGYLAGEGLAAVVFHLAVPNVNRGF